MESPTGSARCPQPSEDQKQNVPTSTGALAVAMSARQTLTLSERQCFGGNAIMTTHRNSTPVSPRLVYTFLGRRPQKLSAREITVDFSRTGMANLLGVHAQEQTCPSPSSRDTGPEGCPSRKKPAAMIRRGGVRRRRRESWFKAWLARK